MVIFYVSNSRKTEQFMYERTKDDLKAIGQIIISTLNSIDDNQKVQNVLSGFNFLNKEYEVIIVDRNSRIIARTSPFSYGEKFIENSINRVLRGELKFATAENYHNHRKVLDLTLPFYYSGNSERIRGAVHIAKTIEAIHKSLSILKRNHILYIIITALFLSLIINILNYELIIKKIKYLSRVMSAIESGNWNKKVRIKSEDEFGQLGKIFNDMLNRIIEVTGNLEKALKEKNDLYQRVQNFNVELKENIRKTTEKLVETQKELIKKERLAIVGEMAASLAHEIRNPLLIIEGSAEMLLKNEKLNENEKIMLEDIVEEVNRLNRSIREILDFSKPIVPEYRKIELNEILDECLRKTIAVNSKKSIIPELHFDDSIKYINCDPELLRRVFINIFTNGVQAIKGKGIIKVTTRSENGSVLIEIEDTGEGIPEKDIGKIFNPFFSSKSGGIGLGLAIVKRIIETLNSEISVNSKLGIGTTFRIKLPVEKTQE